MARARRTRKDLPPASPRAAGLDQLSRERVRMELLKLLLARGAVPAAAAMAEAGLLVRLLGGVPLLASLSNMIKVEAAAGVEPDAIRRLGALGVLVAEDAERLTERLRLANSERDRLAVMGDGWWAIAPHMSSPAARALLYRLASGPLHRSRPAGLDAVRRRAATDPGWLALAKLPARWTAPAFPLAADDFIERGVPKGPAARRGVA